MLPVSHGTTVTGPAIQTDLEKNAGNWAREVKPLMRQGNHNSDVCLPLPNVPATSSQHFTIAPCTSSIVYNAIACMVLSQSPSLYHYGFNSVFPLCNVCNPIQCRRYSISFTHSSFGQFLLAAL